MIEVQKNIVLKHKDGDNEIHLVCQDETQLGKIWDAINAFRVMVYQQIKQNADISEENAEENEVDEATA